MGPERFVAAVHTGGRHSAALDGDQAAGLFPETMSVMGNRWGFALLVAAFVGMSRFTDFQTQFGAPPGSIADRLSIFTANGVFVVVDNRYRLTEKGRALFPVLVTALQWAQRWYPAPEGPAVILTHTVCGVGSPRCWPVTNALGRCVARRYRPCKTSENNLALAYESANLAGAQ